MAPGQVFTKTKEIINDTAKLRNGLLVISLSCTCSLTSSVRVSLSSIGFTLSIIRAPWRSMIRSISWGTSRSKKEIELIKFCAQMKDAKACSSRRKDIRNFERIPKRNTATLNTAHEPLCWPCSTDEAWRAIWIILLFKQIITITAVREKNW